MDQTVSSLGNVSDEKKKKKKKKYKKKVLLERKERIYLPAPPRGKTDDYCFLLFGTSLGLDKCVGFRHAADFLHTSYSKSYYEISHVLYATY